MKNFTNNLKQFTSRLSARWLIMSLMLLAGTSSAWAQDMYVAGSMTNWATNQVKLSTSSSTYSGYYYATFTVEAGTYEYKIKESGNNWWCSTYNTTNSNGVTYSSRSNNCDNIKITVASKGTLEIYHNKSHDNTFAIFYVPCTKSISEESGTYENGEITLSAEFNTCGSAYIGFQWKEENDSWCYDNNADCYVMLGEQNKSNETVTTTLTKSGGTYVFRPYIVVGNTAQDWLYGSEFEVVTCTPVSATNFTVTNNTYTYDGTAKAATVTWKDNLSAEGITVTYNPATPKNAGIYDIQVTTTAHGELCASNGAITLDDKLTINKADQTTALTINASTNICGKEATFSVTGGDGTGDYSYSLDKNDAGVSLNGTTLTATQNGSVTLKAKRLGDDNYNESQETTKEFNFTMPIENVKLSIKQGLSASGDYCVGTEIQLQLTYTGATPANDGNHFEWVKDGFSEIGNNEGGIATGATWTTTLGVNDKTLKVKLKDCNGGWVESNELTFNVFERPVAPKFNPNYMTVCQGEAFTLPGSENEGYIWSDALGKPTTANKPNGIDATTDYYAVISFGCPSDATLYTVNVNPLPTITITGNTSAVFYEDVVLTATGTDIDKVNWQITNGTGTLSSTTGASVKLTSSTPGTVKVKATAISENGCIKESDELSVTFAAEVCNNDADMTKIYLDVSKNTGFITEGNAYVSITASGNKSAKCGDTGGANQKNYYPKNDTWWGQMTKVSGETYIYEITIPNNVTITKGTTKLSFWNKKINTYEDVYSVQAILGQVITNGTNCLQLTADDKTNNQSRQSDFYCGTWTTYANIPQITTPAVKTVSVETEPGEGNIIFEGQVVKTGCAETLTYGFAYSTDANADKSTWTKVQCTNVGNTVGTQFSGSKTELEDGTYYVCAYITNSFGTSFGEAKEKELTTSTEAVTTAEIKLVNQDGTSVEQGHKYCVGETAYIKVESDDVKYTTATWKSDLGVEVEQIGKTNIYQFEVKGKDQIVVLLSNKYNTEPVSSEPLEVDVYASPSVPEIALGASSICNTNEDGTTLTVTRTKAGQYYALYKEDGNGGTLVEDYERCLTDNEPVVFTGLKEAAKYFVKTYTSECRSAISVTSSTTLTVVDSKNVKISIEPTSTETTPWMPVKLTVTATSDYTVTSDPNDAVINISGNIVKVKLPLPTEGVNNKGTTEDDVNVTFEDVPYTITAELKTAGEEGNPCAQPAIAKITLKPYIEICD